MKPDCRSISLIVIVLLCIIPVSGMNHQQLLSAVENYYADLFSVPAGDIVVEIINSPNIDLSAVSSNNIRLSSRIRSPRLGYQSLWLTSAAENIYQVPMSVRVAIYMTVAVADQTIARNATLSQKNVCFHRVLLHSLDPEPITASDEIFGLMSRQHVPEGMVLKQHMVSEKSDVSNGDDVKLLLSRGSLTVETKGRVKNNARIGDRVRVVCNKTGKVLSAKLIDSKTALVKY